MKNIYAIICFLALFIHGQAQEVFQREKRDYTWLVGSAPLGGGQWDVTQLDFHAEPPAVTGFDLNMNFWRTNANISSAAGYLWAYTNGMELELVGELFKRYAGYCGDEFYAWLWSIKGNKVCFCRLNYRPVDKHAYACGIWRKLYSDEWRANAPSAALRVPPVQINSKALWPSHS